MKGLSLVHLSNLKWRRRSSVKIRGVCVLISPPQDLVYSVNLLTVKVWHVWVLTDTMDYQCIIVYTIITILPPNRPGLAANTQWEPQDAAARACCFAWIKCCVKRCAFCVLWVQYSHTIYMVDILPWKLDSSSTCEEISHLCQTWRFKDSSQQILSWAI